MFYSAMTALGRFPSPQRHWIDSTVQIGVLLCVAVPFWPTR